MISSTDPKGRSCLFISRKSQTFNRTKFDLGYMPFFSFVQNALPGLVAFKYVTG